MINKINFKGITTHLQVCHPERSAAESKDLRTITTAWQTFGAQILRLALLAQDDSIGQHPKTICMTGETMQKQDYIAVFDSGVGGISVLRHLLRHLPGERFLYFGDSANAPYGSRTTEEVRQLTLAAAEFLTSEYPVKALVIACNTASALALDTVKEEFDNLS